MEELVRRIAGETGIDTGAADTAVRIILRFLHEDGPSDTVERLAREMGAGDVLDAPAPKAGGFLGSVGGLFGGGGAMAAFSALSAAGLDMDQIQAVVQSFVGHARERVGDEVVDEVIGAIPGLDRLL